MNTDSRTNNTAKVDDDITVSASPDPKQSAYKRCVIYTRKSSEEGLEQDFNSLHAQREACEAYIQSQRHEGWRLQRGEEYLYDDGGLSGGNMDRAGLRRMLVAIRSGKIDVIVVYKVDRLTRSLADFARIVDVMDEHNVSFVSVTQAFNTTSSMGRLTLNVLLSFAQFEREVTAERIRDKIAASKRKGIWMGGPVPLGYRAEDRKLVIDQTESKIVQTVFETYLRTHSLPKTKAELDALGLHSRNRSPKGGEVNQTVGGLPFSHGGLSAILRNPVYVGKTRHKGEIFDGQHTAIIDCATFNAAQQQLGKATGGNRKKKASNSRDRTKPMRGRLLTGHVFDSNGFPMSPTHSNKKGVRYRYYVSTALAQNRKAEAGTPNRVPAAKLEAAIEQAIYRLDEDTNKPGSTVNAEEWVQHIKRVDVTEQGAKLTRATTNDPSDLSESICIAIDWKSPLRRETRLPDRQASKAERLKQRQQETNQTLLRAIAIAHVRYERIKSGEVKSIAELASVENISVRSLRLNLNLAWLAPDIVQVIMDGQLDGSISATYLARSLSSNWQSQRQSLGLS